VRRDAPARGSRRHPRVLLSGEREIRDAAQALRGLRLPDTEILPALRPAVVGRAAPGVPNPHGRRIVLATNVAETSLTVPGIRYVVDPGTARISRYSHRTKVQRLPIEPVSQASADQRAGRCGRIGPGICIRLYAEDDYEARPSSPSPRSSAPTSPRSSSRWPTLGSGVVEDVPVRRSARSPQRSATASPCSRSSAPSTPTRRHPPLADPARPALAALPVDPRLGRMILEAAERECLHEVLVIAAALSIQDPRERPTGPDQAAAAALHARFDVPAPTCSSTCGCGSTSTRRRRGRPGTSSASSAAPSSCTCCASASGRTCTPSSGRPPPASD
jgi:ATP-dependent helicase HrpA